ncbi:MAG: hypothetical protein AOA65_1484 [Candidatus Bathyarchaeota archaeon BA1]|nr:MAG: hypothetical protein AOA65_1484 [Candidatus Bathyarchaeota archaeon BA1]
MRWTRALAWLTLISVAISLAGAYIISVSVLSRTDIIPSIKELINSYGLLGVLVATIIAGTVIPLGARPSLLVPLGSHTRSSVDYCFKCRIHHRGHH